MLGWAAGPCAWRRPASAAAAAMDLSHFACARSARPRRGARPGATSAAAVPPPPPPPPPPSPPPLPSGTAGGPAAQRPRPRKRPRPPPPAACHRPRGRPAASTGYATPGHPEAPLRLLLVGHNPSAASWAAGHGYAHAGNRLWRLLAAGGIVPPSLAAAALDGALPAAVGVGFTDVWLVPGSDAAAVRRGAGGGFRAAFFGRLAAHAGRAAAVAAAAAAADPAAPPVLADGVGVAAAAGGGAASAGGGAVSASGEAAAVAAAGGAAAAAGGGAAAAAAAAAAGEPAFVAFTGKSQFVALFDPAQRVKAVPFGPQTVLPAGWPYTHARVWVLASSSGRAALTDADRLAPYAALGAVLAAVPWPRGGGGGLWTGCKRPPQTSVAAAGESLGVALRRSRCRISHTCRGRGLCEVQYRHTSPRLVAAKQTQRHA
ncbi:hypothetical protein BU14_0403s0005 [Porphyra umbilicalis]|uniref:Uracil-DNA glycosylase-like domain-containing protein n=1 Tax=Porphyra umbilicalis TaxID=2786 RepID=A0A1X6NW47_PORUM|nr:hypothetical protein BU14_0403s0005 [Porphyra umbilicalis]|eukprot:OSX72802.1 hypothetical protein BU14_0403s0005 [Porphyra umbilicalis]